MEQQKRLTLMKISVGAFCFLGKKRQPKTNRSVLLKILSRLFWRENGKKFYFMRPSNKNYARTAWQSLRLNR